MMYAKYRTSKGNPQGAWFISYNPDQGGYKGKDKQAIWKQIRRNAAYVRDMTRYGKVHFYVRSVCGTVITNIILYRDGHKETVAQKI